ncbi:MAG: hypothetical protein ACI9YE_001702 [Psychroserpens sp.]|jgi:hypothetical protein
MTPKLATKLSKFCVRLSAKDECIGSGILFQHDSNYFVLTAKHCVVIEGENKPIGNISIGRWNEGNNSVDDTAQVEEGNIFFNDENDDVALLRIDTNNLLIDELIELCSTLPVDQEEFFFQGFPKGLQSKRPKVVSCTFETHLTNGFSLTPTTSLEDNKTTSISNVGNFSGSGILFMYSSKIYLVGIVTDFAEGFSGFDGINIYPFIDSLLQKAGFKPTSPKDIKSESIKQSDNSRLLSLFKGGLSKIEAYVNSFKPETALREIEDLKLNIEIADLEQKNALLAQCAFFEGQCNKLIGSNSEKSNSLFWKAIELDENNLKYKQLKPYLLYTNGKKGEALLSARKVILEDKMNARAWAVLDHIKQQEQDREEIKTDAIYKAYILSMFIIDKDAELIVADDFDPLLLVDLTNEVDPQEINIANINYWILFAQYALERFIKTPYSQNTFIDAFKGNPKLLYANKLFNQIYQLTKGEEVRGNPNYSIARFYKYFTDFITYEGSSEFERKAVIQRMVDEITDADINTKNPSINVYTILSMISLNGFENETLDVADAITSSEEIPISPEIFFWCAEICDRIKNTKKLKLYLNRYFKVIPTVREKHIVHLIGVLEILQKHKVTHSEKTEMFNDIRDFEKPFLRELLLCHINGFKAELDANTNTLIDGIAKRTDIEQRGVKWAIVIAYYRIHEFKKAKSYFDSFAEEVDFSSNQNELLTYIELIIIAIQENWATESDNKKIFKLWALWRNNFEYREQFNYNELNSAFALKNYELAQEVAEFGLRYSEQKAFYTAHLIDALCFQHERTEQIQHKLDSLLTYDLFEIDFSEQQKLNIISHLFEEHKYSIAIEFFYKLVTENPSRKDLKEKYIFNQFMLGDSWDKYFPNPETVGESNYVKYKLNGDEYYDQIVCGETDDYIYTFLIDKPIGKYEKMNFDEGSKNVVEVIEINHKCIGLKNTIYKQISNGNELRSGGLKVRHFEYKENGELDIEDFNRQLQELSGVSGTKRELYWDELINKYRNIEAGFLDISRFQGSPFTTYDYITHHLYFPTLPICNHNPPKIIADTNFILDFTSLNLFVDLSSQSIVNFEQLNFRFKITQSMYNYVESELKKAKSERSDSMSLSVTLNHVRPIFSNEEYVLRNISRIEKVFKWMKLYCEVEGFSEEKLSIFLEMDKSDVLKDRDDLANIYIETLILSMNDNTLIISDDSNFFKQVPNTISSEYFLYAFKLKSNESQCRMLELNYRSLTVNADTLHYLFNKDKFTNHIGSPYDRALKYSLTDWNPTPKNVLQSLFFLKNIHLDGLSDDFKTKISMDIFYALLSSSCINIDEIRRQLVRFLAKEFNLLQLDKVTLFASFEALAKEMPR